MSFLMRLAELTYFAVPEKTNKETLSIKQQETTLSSYLRIWDLKRSPISITSVSYYSQYFSVCGNYMLIKVHDDEILNERHRTAYGDYS